MKRAHNVSLVGLTSSRSSPGVSSLTVGLARAFMRRSFSPLVIEADPAGGVIGQRFGMPPEPSLLSLLRETSGSITAEGVYRNSLHHSGVHYLLGPVDPSAASLASDQLGRLVNNSGFPNVAPTFVDLGRWSNATHWAQLAHGVNLLLLVTSSRLEDVQSARFAAARCRELGAKVGAVVVGEAPFKPIEVAEALELQLLGSVPHDPSRAMALCGEKYSEGAFNRSPLGLSIDQLASTVASAAQ